MLGSNILYIGDDEIVLPTKWCICGQCKGHGKSSAYLGAYTADEMDQMDDQWQEDYFAGNFDRACDTCRGSGKVQKVDHEKLTAEQKTAWYKQCEDDRLERAIRLSEIRAGA